MVASTEVSSPRSFEQAITDLEEQINKNPDMPLSRLLPLMFQLKGDPYSLQWSHFMFEPMFRFKQLPTRMLWKTGRQVGKTTAQSASQIVRAAMVKYYSILTVLPLSEQARVFSSNNVAPFLSGSPVKETLMEESESDSVMQRDVGRGSKLYYGYSHGGADRLRGKSVEEVNYDELQGIDPDDIPVIDSCMSASKYRLNRYTGTPLTFDNQIQVFWDDSSQAVWHIECVCGHVNRCSVDGDLMKMLKPKTLSCAKCDRPANSRAGFWVHGHPERRAMFAGYHVAQAILPMHYENPRNWKILLDQLDPNVMPLFRFYNEVLGESFDSGAKLLTFEELKAACTAPSYAPAATPNGAYLMQATGIDWGGRGKEKTSDTDDFISNTAFAVACLHPAGYIDVTYLHKVPYSVDPSNETEMAVNIAVDSMSSWIALDYGGQGNVQEQMLRARGWPANKICPFTYGQMAPSKPIVFYSPPAAGGVRSSYTLDKARSLLLLYGLIKRGIVRLPNELKYLENHLKDLLNVTAVSMDNPRGSPRTVVVRMARRTDDVLHAINYAVMCIFHATGAWPKLAEAFIER